MPSTLGLSLVIAVMAWVMIVPVAAEPSEQPSGATSEQPSGATSQQPSGATSQQPSGATSQQPSGATSQQPSGATSQQPSGATSQQPSGATSQQPSGATSEQPSGATSQQPSGATSRQPSGATEASTKPETERRPLGRPGMMLGPGVITPQMRGSLCGSSAAGFTHWRTADIAKAVKPTDAQRTQFENLKTASAKAAEMLRDTCSHDIPNTPTGRMEALDKRLDAMLSAVRTVRPALEAFYGSLSDEQKASFNSVIHTRPEH